MSSKAFISWSLFHNVFVFSCHNSIWCLLYEVFGVTSTWMFSVHIVLSYIAYLVIFCFCFIVDHYLKVCFSSFYQCWSIKITTKQWSCMWIYCCCPLNHVWRQLKSKQFVFVNVINLNWTFLLWTKLSYSHRSVYFKLNFALIL